MAQLAASVLLGRSWPKTVGSRQRVAMAVAGFLLRNGLLEEQVARIISVAAQIAGDEEYHKRVDCVKDTAKALLAGENITGGPSIAASLDNSTKILERLDTWLKLKITEQQYSWEQPLPLIDNPEIPFPVKVLPEPVRQYTMAQSTALQTPVDLLASLVLGVGAAAVAGRCVVRLNKEWVEPLNLFIVISLPSGERKSPAYRAVTATLEERERDLSVTLKPEIEMQRAERDILESQLRFIA